MSKNRKKHQLIATITKAYLGYSKSKTYKNQPFYYLDILEQTQFGKNQQDVYAFANLVNKDVWNALASNSFKNKNYLLFCEKRTRGWRLRDWKEIS
ncbi:MAG: hypothetical protein GBAus27B_000313 [Mycoplasmataceae bacterium]|nr:MAG: hypothetical protein GBAus27B_000313 [Mycoplasmataceae bacterium]